MDEREIEIAGHILEYLKVHKSTYSSKHKNIKDIDTNRTEFHVVCNKLVDFFEGAPHYVVRRGSETTSSFSLFADDNINKFDIYEWHETQNKTKNKQEDIDELNHKLLRNQVYISEYQIKTRYLDRINRWFDFVIKFKTVFGLGILLLLVSLGSSLVQLIKSLLQLL